MLRNYSNLILAPMFAWFFVGCSKPQLGVQSDLDASASQSSTESTQYDVWSSRGYHRATKLQVLRSWNRDYQTPSVPPRPFQPECVPRDAQFLDLLDFELSYQVELCVDRCSRLRWLRARITKQDQIRWLGKKRNLEGLILYFATDSPQKIRLDHLAGIKRLRYLDLIQANGFVTRPPKLRNLDTLLFSHASQGTILRWKGSPVLRVLNIPHSKVTSRGLSQLTFNFPNLETLNLYGRGAVSSEDVFHLARLRKLKKLGIGLATISKADFLALKEALPGCEIDTAD